MIFKIRDPHWKSFDNIILIRLNTIIIIYNACSNTIYNKSVFILINNSYIKLICTFTKETWTEYLKYVTYGCVFNLVFSYENIRQLCS